jgi:DNA polymerase-3 subunit alpha
MVQGVYDENRFQPGRMEFTIQNIMLLDDVRKVMAKRLHLSIPLHKIDDAFVGFMDQNIKSHPGSTELILHISDWDGMETRLKTQNKKVEINDDLLKFIDEYEEIKYSLDKA